MSLRSSEKIQKQEVGKTTTIPQNRIWKLKGSVLAHVIKYCVPLKYESQLFSFHTDICHADQFLVLLIELQLEANNDQLVLHLQDDDFNQMSIINSWNYFIKVLQSQFVMDVNKIYYRCEVYHYSNGNSTRQAPY